MSQDFFRLLIDKNLNWRPHINYVTNKISKTIDILYNLRESVGKRN